MDGKVHCSKILTRKVKLWPECRWTVNSSIFQRLVLPPDSNVYICDGMDEEDQVCGKEVLPTMKFCPHCGTKRKHSILPVCT